MHGVPLRPSFLYMAFYWWGAAYAPIALGPAHEPLTLALPVAVGEGRVTLPLPLYTYRLIV